jgi:PAS domain S-box-containing protein
MTSEPSKRRTTAESSTKTGERPTAMPSEDLQKRIHELHELLEMAARAAEIGVWNYDLERGTTNWNEQLYRLLGLPPREGTEDPERFFEFVHPEDRTGKITALQAILTNSDDEIDEEFRILRADGNIRWLAARGRLYRDESGRVVRISGIYYDITERNQAE